MKAALLAALLLAACEVDDGLGALDPLGFDLCLDVFCPSGEICVYDKGDRHCERLCRQNSECASGCCASTNSGAHACGPVRWCPASAGAGGTEE